MYLTDWRKIQKLSSELSEAALEGDLEQVLALIAAGADITFRGNEPVKLAARNGNTDVVRALIERGADFETDSEWTMHFAAIGSDLKLTIERSQKLPYHTYPEDCIDSGLIEAVAGGHLDTTEMLIQICPPNAFLPRQNQILTNRIYEAASYGKPEMMTLLIKYIPIPKFNHRVDRCRTLNNYDLIPILLETQQDVWNNFAADAEFSMDDLIFYPLSKGYTRVFEHMLQNYSYTLDHLKKALHAVCLRGKMKLVDWIMTLSPELEITAEHVNYALSFNHIKAARKLMARIPNAAINLDLMMRADLESATVLFIIENFALNRELLDQLFLTLVKNNDDALIAQRLINLGANPRVEEDKALTLAASFGSVETVKLLLDHELDCTQEDNSPIRHAAQGHHLKIVQILLERGAWHSDVIDYLCNRWITRAGVTTQSNSAANLEFIQKLIVKQDIREIPFKTMMKTLYFDESHDLAAMLLSVDPNLAKNDDCLRIVINKNATRMLELFIQNGAVITDTLLEIACEHGHLNMVMLLASVGANLHVNEEEPFMMAVDGGHLDVMEFILKDGVAEGTMELALLRAVYMASESAVNYLISLGVDPKTHNSDIARLAVISLKNRIMQCVARHGVPIDAMGVLAGLNGLTSDTVNVLYKCMMKGHVVGMMNFLVQNSLKAAV